MAMQAVHQAETRSPGAGWAEETRRNTVIQYQMIDCGGGLLGNQMQ